MIRHDALRLSFEKQDNQWEQSYTSQGLQLATDDLKNSTKADLSKSITGRAAHYQQSLDIQAGPLLPDGIDGNAAKRRETNRLLMVIHRLGRRRGMAWRILLEDLEELLSTISKEEQPKAVIKSSSYRQWRAALTSYGGSKAAGSGRLLAKNQQQLSALTGRPALFKTCTGKRPARTPGKTKCGTNQRQAAKAGSTKSIPYRDQRPACWGH